MQIQTGRLLSISAGKVAPLFVKEGDERVRQVYSAIRKNTVSTLDNPHQILVESMGVQGDEQSNMQVHGGIDKAVYMMPSEHYAFWLKQLETFNPQLTSLDHGFLGENLTVQGLTESTLYIGDEIIVGEIILRITEPREPCFKFNARMGYNHASKHMVQQGNCGWYLRVVKQGAIQAGQLIEIKAGPRRKTVAEQFAWMTKRAQQNLFD